MKKMKMKNIYRKKDKSKKKKKKKKRIKAIFNSFLLICGSISFRVRVLALFDVSLVKCCLPHSFNGF